VHSDAILAEWARTSSNAPHAVHAFHTTASLGYDHPLSKRTDVYAVYMYDKLSTAGTANTAALGIRHMF
jgi:predicted porin